MIRQKSNMLTTLALLSLTALPEAYETYYGPPARPRLRTPAEKAMDDEKYFKAEQKRARKNAKRAALAAAQGEKP